VTENARNVWAPALVALAVTALAIPAAATSDDCLLAEGCYDEGMCSMTPDGCVMMSEGDCLTSDACQREGRCSYDGDVCVVGKAGCAKSPACTAYGLCAAGAERCEPTASGCKKSFACKALGECRLTKVGPKTNNILQADACRSNGDTDCAKSAACKHLGRCVMTQHAPMDMACVARGKSCERSTLCALDGQCTANDEEECVATDASCARSAACKELGMCAAEGEPRCLAYDEAACKASTACKEDGACVLDKDKKVCVVTLPTNERGGYCPKFATSTRVSKVVTSSTHPTWKEYAFGGEQLIDGFIETSWQPRTKKGGGVGESVTLILPKAAPITGLRVANGFLRRDRLGDLFLWNNRLRHVVVEAGDSKQVAYFYPDHRGYVDIRFPPATTDRVKLTVRSIYPGLLWNDLAISEIEVLTCVD